MQRQLNYVIADRPDSDDLVAELWYGDQMIGTLLPGATSLSFLPAGSPGDLPVDLRAFRETLDDAERRMLELYPRCATHGS